MSIPPFFSKPKRLLLYVKEDIEEAKEILKDLENKYPHNDYRITRYGRSKKHYIVQVFNEGLNEEMIGFFILSKYLDFLTFERKDVEDRINQIINRVVEAKDKDLHGLYRYLGRIDHEGKKVVSLLEGLEFRLHKREEKE